MAPHSFQSDQRDKRRERESSESDEAPPPKIHASAYTAAHEQHLRYAVHQAVLMGETTLQSVSKPAGVPICHLSDLGSGRTLILPKLAKPVPVRRRPSSSAGSLSASSLCSPFTGHRSSPTFTSPLAKTALRPPSEGFEREPTVSTYFSLPFGVPQR